MKRFHLPLRTVIGAVMAGLFVFETAAVNAAEASLWAERRRAMNAARAQAPSASDTSDDSKDKKSTDGETLLAALPAIHPGLTTIATPDTPGAELATIDPARVVPAWIQTAINPFATLQTAHLSGNPDAATVIVMQDAHLHPEAQRNIAESIEALATDLSKKNDKLLVAMEGAAKGPVDYSGYAKAGTPALRREVSRAMIERRILSGAEAAAVATAGIRNGQELFATVGAENFAMYRANVEALRQSAPLRSSAEKAIFDLRRELVDLKKKHFDENLIRFDGRKASYEDGKLGLPTYAVYLDSVVPASSKNLHELIEAALLEGSLKFSQVESERRRLLAKLVEKMSDAEVKGLLQASLMFRAGQFTYASYYDLIRRLAEKHGVPLSGFPEMNIYIQYVLKAESIDHRSVFAELADEERAVQAKLASTDAQRDLLSLDSDLHLLQKLIDRSLIESEWHTYEARRPEIEKLLDRVSALGGNRPATAVDMAPHWKDFDAFYTSALARNDAMTTNVTDAAEKAGAKYALVVAGGFHTDGLALLLEKKGLNVFVVSPKITNVGDGPSSLDFLASGRLPLNEIFAGEKLFLPTPPPTALDTRPNGETTGPTVAELVQQVTVGVVQDLGDLRAGNEDTVRESHDGLAFVGHKPGSAVTVPSTGVDFQFGDGSSVSVEQFTSAFDGVSFNRIVQAARVGAGMGGYEFGSFMLNLLRASGVNVQTQFRNRMDLARYVASLLRPAPVGPRGLRAPSTPASRLGDAIARSGGMLNPFVELMLIDYIRTLQYRPNWTHVNTVIEQNQQLAPVAEIPADISASVSAVRAQLGLSDTNVSVEMFSNDRTRNLSQVDVTSTGGQTRYVIRVSQEFIAEKIDGRIAEVISRAGFTNDAAGRAKARAWLLRQWANHELAEALLRRDASTSEAGQQNRAAVHQLLINNGFGLELPRNRADYAREPALLLKDLIGRNPALFAPNAASRISATPAAATPATAPAATTTAARPAAAPATAPATPAPAPTARTAASTVAARPYNAANGKTYAMSLGEAFAISPDGSRVAVISNGNVQILDAHSGGVVATVPVDSADFMSFSPNGTRLVVGNASGTANIIDLSNPTNPTRTVLTGHTDRVSAVAFSADGTRVVTGSWDQTVREWDATTGRSVRTYSGAQSAILAVGVDAAGRVLAVSVLRLNRWNNDGSSAASDLLPEGIRGTMQRGVSVAISPDGQKVALEVGSEMRIYRTSDMTVLQRFATGLPSAVSVAFSGDGRQVAASLTDFRDQNEIQVFDVASGVEPVRSPATTRVEAVAPSQRVASLTNRFGRIGLNRNGTALGFTAPGARNVQIQTRSSGAVTAFVGWRRGIAIAATLSGLALAAVVHASTGFDPTAFGVILLSFTLAVVTAAAVVGLVVFRGRNQRLVIALATAVGAVAAFSPLILPALGVANSASIAFGLVSLALGLSTTTLLVAAEEYGHFATAIREFENGTGEYAKVRRDFRASPAYGQLVAAIDAEFAEEEAAARGDAEKTEAVRQAKADALAEDERAAIGPQFSFSELGIINVRNEQGSVLWKGQLAFFVAGLVPFLAVALVLHTPYVLILLPILAFANREGLTWMTNRSFLRSGARLVAGLALGLLGALMTLLPTRGTAAARPAVAETRTTAASRTVAGERTAAARTFSPTPAGQPIPATPTVDEDVNGFLVQLAALRSAPDAETRGRILERLGKGRAQLTTSGLSLFLALASYYRQDRAFVRNTLIVLYNSGRFGQSDASRQVARLFINVITDPAMTIDRLFDNALFQRLPSHVQQTLVAALLLRNRTDSPEQLAAKLTSAADPAEKARREKSVANVRNSVSLVLPGDEGDKTPLTLDQVLSATQAMVAMKAARAEIKEYLDRREEELRNAGTGTVESFIDDAGAEIAAILARHVPRLANGASLPGFDNQLLRLFQDTITPYVSRLAAASQARDNDPTQAWSLRLLGRLVSSAYEDGESIYTWATNNVYASRAMISMQAAVVAWSESTAEPAAPVLSRPAAATTAPAVDSPADDSLARTPARPAPVAPAVVPVESDASRALDAALGPIDSLLQRKKNDAQNMRRIDARLGVNDSRAKFIVIEQRLIQDVAVAIAGELAFLATVDFNRLTPGERAAIEARVAQIYDRITAHAGVVADRYQGNAGRSIEEIRGNIFQYRAPGSANSIASLLGRLGNASPTVQKMNNDVENYLTSPRNDLPGSRNPLKARRAAPERPANPINAILGEREGTIAAEQAVVPTKKSEANKQAASRESRFVFNVAVAIGQEIAAILPADGSQLSEAEQNALEARLAAIYSRLDAYARRVLPLFPGQTRQALLGRMFGHEENANRRRGYASIAALVIGRNIGTRTAGRIVTAAADRAGISEATLRARFAPRGRAAAPVAREEAAPAPVAATPIVATPARPEPVAPAVAVDPLERIDTALEDARAFLFDGPADAATPTQVAERIATELTPVVELNVGSLNRTQVEGLDMRLDILYRQVLEYAKTAAAFPGETRSSNEIFLAIIQNRVPGGFSIEEIVTSAVQGELPTIQEVNREITAAAETARLDAESALVADAVTQAAGDAVREFQGMNGTLGERRVSGLVNRLDALAGGLAEAYPDLGRTREDILGQMLSEGAPSIADLAGRVPSLNGTGTRVARVAGAYRTRRGTGTEAPAAADAEVARARGIAGAAAAYVGRLRGAVVLVSVLAFILYFGARADLVSFGWSGLVATLVGTLVAGVLIYAEERGHYNRAIGNWEAERERYFEELDNDPFIGPGTRAMRKMRYDDTRPSYDWARLRVANAGNDVGMLAAGQLAFFGLGFLLLVAGSFVLGATALLAGLPLLIGLSFVNAEGLWGRDAWIPRAFPGIRDRLSGLLSRSPEETEPDELAPAPATPAPRASAGPSLAYRVFSAMASGMSMTDREFGLFVAFLITSPGAAVVSIASGLGLITIPAVIIAGGVLIALLTELISNGRKAASEEEEAPPATPIRPAATGAAAPRAARPVAPAGARPAASRPSAAPRAPVPANAPIVAPSVSGTVRDRVSVTYGLIRGNRTRERKGTAARPVIARTAQDVVAFYLALAAFRPESKSYYKQADAALRLADGMPAGVAGILIPLLQEVVTNDSLTIDGLFDLFESDPGYGRLTPQLRGYAVAAFLLKNRAQFDAANPLSDALYRQATTSTGAKAAQRNAAIAAISQMPFRFSGDGEDNLLSLNEIARVSRAMQAMDGAIRGPILGRLNNAIRSFGTPSTDGTSAGTRFVDNVGLAVSAALHDLVPPVGAGNDVFGFDEKLGTLLDVLNKYAGILARKAGTPERQAEIFGRLLVISRDTGPAIPSIFQWAMRNIQGREQLDRLQNAVIAYNAIRERRAAEAAAAVAAPTGGDVAAEEREVASDLPSATEDESIAAHIGPEAPAPTTEEAVAAFFNNNVIRQVSEAIVGRSVGGSVDLYRNVMSLIYALETLAQRARTQDSGINPAIVGPIQNALTKLGWLVLHLAHEDATKVITEDILGRRYTVEGGPANGVPLFDLANELADVFMEQTGYLPDTTSREATVLRRELFSLLPNFNFGDVTVEVQLYRSDAQAPNGNLAFVQRFGNRVVIRVTDASLAKIRDLKGYFKDFNEQAGIRMSDQEAEALAVQYFLLHEIGEKVLGISDEQLLKMGLADRQRLEIQDEDGGRQTSRLLPTVEGILGEFERLKPGTVNSIQDSRATEPVSPVDIRQAELQAIEALAPANRILNALFPGQRVDNYMLGFGESADQVIFNPNGSVDLAGLRALRRSQAERSRLGNLNAQIAAGATFRNAAQVYAEIGLKNPDTLGVFDQKGGFKDMADQYADFLDANRSNPAARKVFGVLQTAGDFTSSLQAYVNFLSAKVADNAKTLQAGQTDPLRVDLERAQQLLRDIRVPNLEGGRASIITISEAQQERLTANAANQVDVSFLKDYFQTRANAILGVGAVQRIVFISDWRQLVANQIGVAAQTMMNVNAFITLDGRMKAETLVAVQA